MNWFIIAVALACVPCGFSQSGAASSGIFEGQSDVGTVLHPGTVDYDQTTRTYTVTGSGDNMWFASDNFHFVWKKVSATAVTLDADLSILGEAGDNHRKGVLMIRQTLDSDSAYADAALHGDGLTSLQTRDAQGAVTHEVEASVSKPKHLRLEKRGDWFYLSTGSDREHVQFAGGSMRVPLKAPFYVGIGVCAHNKDAVQKVAFENVEVNEAAGSKKQKLYSTVQTIAVASTDSRVSYAAPKRIGAPVWDADGKSLLFESEGKTNRVALAGGEPEALPSGTKERKSSARTSPDGKQVAVLTLGKSVSGGFKVAELSVESAADHKSKFLIRFVGDGKSLGDNPWSPDSKRLVFTSYQLMTMQ